MLLENGAGRHERAAATAAEVAVIALRVLAETAAGVDTEAANARLALRDRRGRVAEPVEVHGVVEAERGGEASALGPVAVITLLRDVRCARADGRVEERGRRRQIVV